MAELLDTSPSILASTRDHLTSTNAQPHAPSKALSSLYTATKSSYGQSLPSSPANSLAIDMSLNFHIAQTPSIPTPKRSLFTSSSPLALPDPSANADAAPATSSTWASPFSDFLPCIDNSLLASCNTKPASTFFPAHAHAPSHIQQLASSLSSPQASLEYFDLRPTYSSLAPSPASTISDSSSSSSSFEAAAASAAAAAASQTTDQSDDEQEDLTLEDICPPDDLTFSASRELEYNITSSSPLGELPTSLSKKNRLFSEPSMHPTILEDLSAYESPKPTTGTRQLKAPGLSPPFSPSFDLARDTSPCQHRRSNHLQIARANSAIMAVSPHTSKTIKCRRTQSMVQNQLDFLSPGTLSQVSPRTLQTSPCMIDENEHTSHFEKSLAPVVSSPFLEQPAHKMPIASFQVKEDPFHRIHSATLCEILDGKYKHHYAHHLVIDCRFEYEYDGGHIEGAMNVNSKEKLEDLFFKDPNSPFLKGKTLLIFHCEYSAQRGPRMALHLRNCDRHINMARYPALHYTDVVVLDGGYSSFFRQHHDRCFPQRYVEMKDSSHRHTYEREISRFRRVFRTQSHHVRGSPQHAVSPCFRFPLASKTESHLNIATSPVPVTVTRQKTFPITLYVPCERGAEKFR